MESVKINLTIVPIEALLLTVDYFKAQHNINIFIDYNDIEAIIGFDSEVSDSYKTEFTEELNDYIKRVLLAERVRPIKEMIIGRALYGIVNGS